MKLKSVFYRAAAAGAVLAPLAARADDASDPLTAASTQISTWTPVVGTLLVAAFGIAVLFKGLRLGKKGINAA